MDTPTGHAVDFRDQADHAADGRAAHHAADDAAADHEAAHHAAGDGGPVDTPTGHAVDFRDQADHAADGRAAHHAADDAAADHATARHGAGDGRPVHAPTGHAVDFRDQADHAGDDEAGDGAGRRQHRTARRFHGRDRRDDRGLRDTANYADPQHAPDHFAAGARAACPVRAYATTAATASPPTTQQPPTTTPRPTTTRPEPLLAPFGDLLFGEHEDEDRQPTRETDEERIERLRRIGVFDAPDTDTSDPYFDEALDFSVPDQGPRPGHFETDVEAARDALGADFGRSLFEGPNESDPYYDEALDFSVPGEAPALWTPGSAGQDALSAPFRSFGVPIRGYYAVRDRSLSPLWSVSYGDEQEHASALDRLRGDLPDVFDPGLFFSALRSQWGGEIDPRTGHPTGLITPDEWRQQQERGERQLLNLADFYPGAPFIDASKDSEITTSDIPNLALGAVEFAPWAES